MSGDLSQWRQREKERGKAAKKGRKKMDKRGGRKEGRAFQSLLGIKMEQKKLEGQETSLNNVKGTNILY